MAQQKLFSVGQTVYIEPKSSVYRGIYQARVLEEDDTTLTISLPYKNGKIILLSVGTGLAVRTGEAPDSPGFDTEISERRLRSLPCILVPRPEVAAQAATPQRTGLSRVIAVTSGKGGVGKTTFTINMAITLANMGYQTFLIDADLGTANVDVLLNLNPKYNLTHVVNGEKTLSEIIVEGPAGVQVIPGGSGLQELANLNDFQFSRLIKSFDELERYADVILVDTGAGISKNVTNFLLASDDVIVITTPEPHSLMDAYAIMKVIGAKKKAGIQVVINRVETAFEADDAYRKLSSAAERFLGIKTASAGYILEDPTVSKTIKRQQAFMEMAPNTLAAQCVRRIAAGLMQPGGQQATAALPVKRRGFFERLRNLIVQG
ncbi:MAG: AAA family ATPase [Chloroflexota bacterium]